MMNRRRYTSSLPKACLSAFTMLELLIVLVLLAITFGLVWPAMSDLQPMRLRAAARLLASDLELAQTESIAHPDNPRVIRFKPTTADTYWLAASRTPDTPLVDPYTQQQMLTTFGLDRASACTGVTVQSSNLGVTKTLQFDAYGAPTQASDATITLACGTYTMTIRVSASSGEVNIQ